MTALAMTLPVARRSPTEIPRRDLALDVGDALTLALTIVAADRPDAAAVDLLGLGPRVVVAIWYAAEWGDYGLPSGRALVHRVEGVMLEDEPGRADVTLARGFAVDWGRRVGWSVHLDYAGALSCIAWGALHVQTGAAMAEKIYDVLDDAFAPVTDETPAVVEV